MTFQIVTGGAGFIGSHICEGLLGEGAEVLLIDDFSTGKESNVEGFQANPRLRIENVSILDGEALPGLFKGAQYVFHQAAIPSVQKSLDRPRQSNDVNIGGTLNVLLAARAAGVKRVVYAASSSIYGDTEVLPKREDFAPQPLSPYALQKYVGELYGGIFFNLFGLESTALRYFNVFGPRQDPRSEYAAVIPRFATAMLQGKQPTIFGDGEQSRDFTYVENVVEANLRAARAPKAAGAVMNIGLGDRISLNHIVGMINELLGTSIQAVYKAARGGDVRHSQASIQLAEELIGFRPQVTFRDGLGRTVAWYKERLSQFGS